MIRNACHALCLSAITVAALPPPTEYTMEMFVQDLDNARLVALVRVLDIDTPAGTVEQFEVATLRVDTCYKGGLATGDTVIHAKRDTGMRGWYEPDYRIGERSYMGFADTWKDGIHAFANTRAKFDITASDSVEPPPVGLGFSNEFAAYRSAVAFGGLLRQTVRGQEFLHVTALLPYSGSPVAFGTTINLSGGAVLESVTLTHSSSVNRIDMELVYTPCTGICPLIYLLKDTSVSLTVLAPGDYTAYRTKANSLLDAIPAPDDTVRFTVYGITSVLPRVPPAVCPARVTGHAAPMVVDLRGRAVPGSARAAPAAGLLIEDNGAGALRPALRATPRSREQR